MRERRDSIEAIGELRGVAEQVAALQGGWTEIAKMEKERPKLMAAVNNLPADGGGEAGARLHAAIDEVDARIEEFVGHCGRLQATVATMALTGDRKTAMEELAQVTAGFGHQVEAEAEIDRAVSGARRRQGEGEA